MTQRTKTVSRAGWVAKTVVFAIAIAAVGYFGINPSTLSEIWQVFNHGDEPVATQPAE